MEKKTENLPVEEEGQDALVDYDSNTSIITVIERERDSEKTIRKNKEEKDKKEETETRGAILKKNMPKVRENIDVTKAWEENRPVLPIGTKILYEKQEKLVAKMDKAMQMLDKIMTKVTGMMENMVEISHLNLEKEKVKLRSLKVNNKNTQNSVQNDITTVKELEVESRKRKLDETRVCSAGKNRSLETIKSAIELELNSQRLHIRREYKLTQKSNFNLWMDYLKSELMNNDLLDVIDSNIESPKNLSELKVAKRKCLVRDIIINHLDKNYHKRILHEKDQKEILKKLRGYKKSEINVIHASVQARLYQIKMRKNEKVSDFCARFDSIIREYESCENAVPLTEQEIRSAFYQAVLINVPELRNVHLIRRQSSLKEMTIDEIKSFMIQLEAEKKSEKLEKSEVRVQRATAEEHKEVKCYRCNKLGHMAKDCPLAGSDAWFCYYCQEIRGHKGDSCPNAGAQANKFRGKRYLNKTVNKHINKKGRFAQKGTKRVDNKGKITKIQPAKKPNLYQQKQQKKKNQKKVNYA
ncbi:uncharacterized protein LOC143896412 [Temnothorax americanus]|uniref:uncharacterized protein LOC143896412 n=1 Tax=Temnothorax americanus TaxID=1964332 RepID=UPI00406808F9